MSQELRVFEFWIAMGGTMAFAVTAVLAVAPRGIDLFGACVMGVVTAIGGGLMRDMLAGNQTLLMKKELYAVPVILGTVVYVAALPFLPGSQLALSIVCALLIFGIRAAAIHWNLSVPDWAISRPKQED